MDGGDGERASVKAAIFSYEQQIHGKGPILKKTRSKEVAELESMKREVAELRRKMGFIREGKKRAERTRDASISKEKALLQKFEALSMEIDDINEEHVLFEVARLEAIKECRADEARKGEMVEKYRERIEEAMKKTRSIVEEMGNVSVAEMEQELAVTIRHVSELENELRKMDKGLEREAIKRELESKREELARVKEQNLEYMAAMEITGNELRRVNAAAERLKMKEENASRTIQLLNAKIRREKSKMEVISEAAENAESLSSNLSLALEKVNAERRSAKEEMNLHSKMTSMAKEEAQKAEKGVEFMKAELESAKKDLISAKSSEQRAMEKLKRTMRNIVTSRASSPLSSSKITISKFEYDYLIGKAASAVKISEMKIAAARAWIEALKCSEKEITMEIDFIRKGKRESRAPIEKSESTSSSDDFERWQGKMKPEKLGAVPGKPPGSGANSHLRRRGSLATPAARKTATF